MSDFNVARPTQLNVVYYNVYLVRSSKKCWNPGPLGNSNIWSNPISNTNFDVELSMKCIPLFYKTSCKWNEGSSNSGSMVRTLFGLEKKPVPCDADLFSFLYPSAYFYYASQITSNLKRGHILHCALKRYVWLNRYSNFGTFNEACTTREATCCFG